MNEMNEIKCSNKMHIWLVYFEPNSDIVHCIWFDFCLHTCIEVLFHTYESLTCRVQFKVSYGGFELTLSKSRDHQKMFRFILSCWTKNTNATRKRRTPMMSLNCPSISHKHSV